MFKAECGSYELFSVVCHRFKVTFFDGTKTGEYKGFFISCDCLQFPSFMYRLKELGGVVCCILVIIPVLNLRFQRRNHNV